MVIPHLLEMFLLHDVKTCETSRFKVGPSFKDVQNIRVCVELNRSTGIGVDVKMKPNRKTQEDVIPRDPDLCRSIVTTSPLEYCDHAFWQHSGTSVTARRGAKEQGLDFGDGPSPVS